MVGRTEIMVHISLICSLLIRMILLVTNGYMIVYTILQEKELLPYDSECYSILGSVNAYT